MKADGSACVAIAADCANTMAANCVKSTAGYCYLVTSTCTAHTTALAAGSCATVTGTKLTAAYCKGISSDACSVNAALTACIEKKDTCAAYTTLTECFSSINETKCVLNAAGTGCIKFDDSTDACSVIKINGLTTNYTDIHCK